MVMTKAQAGRLGAHSLWASTEDRTAHTAPGRNAFLARFEREVDPDGVLPVEERQKRAEHAKRAYMQRLAIEGAAKRRKNVDRASRVARSASPVTPVEADRGDLSSDRRPAA